MASKPGIELSKTQRELLREGRILLGVTQVELAAKVGVPQSAIVNYEAGKRKPSIEVLERWADELGYEVVQSGVEIRPKRKGK